MNYPKSYDKIITRINEISEKISKYEKSKNFSDIEKRVLIEPLQARVVELSIIYEQFEAEFLPKSQRKSYNVDKQKKGNVND